MEPLSHGLITDLTVHHIIMTELSPPFFARDFKYHINSGHAILSGYVGTEFLPMSHIHVHLHYVHHWHISSACICVYHLHILLFTQSGRTPLMVASFEGHSDIVKMLIEANAQVNIKDKVCDVY